MLDRAQVCKLKAPITVAVLCKARGLTLGMAIVKAGKDNSGLEKLGLHTIPPALVPGTILVACALPESLSTTPVQMAFHPAEPLTAAIKLLLLVFLLRSVHALTFDPLRN
jgi:hypothetical protein